MFSEEYEEEALLIRKVVSDGYSILIEPGQELDWSGNYFPFRVTILSDGNPLAYEEGHKIGLCISHLARLLTQRM